MGCSTLAPWDRDDLPVTLEVEARTLDEIAQTEGLRRLDLIKVDAEGWDMHVLWGAKDSIQAFQPLVIFEYAEGLEGARLLLKSARDWFSGLGYRLFVITRKCLMSLEEDLSTKSCNILAVPAASCRLEGGAYVYR